ncbi:hypothetical protein ACLOJK_027891 [Asimina triloba]
MERNDGCWRKEVDEKLKRLHSLLFGANAALERSDFASAQILSLRLLGFLHSVSQKAPSHEQASIHHICNVVLTKIDAARRSLALESDRESSSSIQMFWSWVQGCGICCMSLMDASDFGASCGD